MELHQPRRQPVAADAVGHPQPDSPGERAVGRGLKLELAHQPLDVAGDLEHRLARRGHPHAMGDPAQQLGAEAFFQAIHPTPDGRLRGAERERGGAEAAGAGRLEIVAQIVPVGGARMGDKFLHTLFSKFD